MNISIVIPVKDEELSIETLLLSIERQSRQPDEVILIDAGSTDNTRSVIEDFKRHGFTAKLISIGQAYPGRARNAGVRESGYDVIAFTDAGIELDREWLKELAAVMEKDPSVDVVYGSYAPRSDTVFKVCFALAVVPPAEKRSSFIASSLLKRTVWERVGGFPDFRAGEDRIFMERISKNGFKTAFNAKAAVTWDVPEGLRRTLGRFYLYSYHDLKAGRGRDWHVPVLKMYLVAALLAVLGVACLPVLLVVPAVGFFARVAKKIYVNRRESYFRISMIPVYSVMVAIIILTVDLAMFAGSARYALDRMKR